MRQRPKGHLFGRRAASGSAAGAGADGAEAPVAACGARQTRARVRRAAAVAGRGGGATVRRDRSGAATITLAAVLATQPATGRAGAWNWATRWSPSRCGIRPPRRSDRGNRHPARQLRRQPHPAGEGGHRLNGPPRASRPRGGASAAAPPIMPFYEGTLLEGG